MLTTKKISKPALVAFGVIYQEFDQIQTKHHKTMCIFHGIYSCQIRNIVGCACAGNAGVNYPCMHHGTCLTDVPWCMLGSLTSSFLWSWWCRKCSQHSRCMRNPQYCGSGKRPMGAWAPQYNSPKMPVLGPLSPEWCSWSPLSLPAFSYHRFGIHIIFHQ